MELLSLSTLKSSDQIKREPLDIKREPGLDHSLTPRDGVPAQRYRGTPDNQLVPDLNHSDPRQRRRAQNRKAARKFREKKRFHANNIIQDYDTLRKENTRLRHDLDLLQAANLDLEDKLRRLLAEAEAAAATAEPTPLATSIECSLLSHRECEEYFLSLDDVASVIQAGKPQKQQYQPKQQIHQQQQQQIQQQQQQQQQQQPLQQQIQQQKLQQKTPQQPQQQYQYHQQQHAQVHQHHVDQQYHHQQQQLQQPPHIQNAINYHQHMQFQHQSPPPPTHHINMDVNSPYVVNDIVSPASSQYELYKCEPSVVFKEEPEVDHSQVYPAFVDL